MPLEIALAPKGPYSLAHSAWRSSDATRLYRDGVLTAVFETDGVPTLARAWQRSDGTVVARLDGRLDEAAQSGLRFMLALEDDHSEFLRRFRDDPLVGPTIRHLGGMRPLRVATVVHALLKAVCGQLIQWKAARLLERRLLHFAATPYAGLLLPPTRATFARYAPAELERLGLVSRKATTLVRLSRELDVERLREAPSAAVTARVERERGLGPWSAGMVALFGLGRYDVGLVGDLGLIKLCSALRGHPAGVEESRELLEPYAEWAGLASVYLLSARSDATPAAASARARRIRLGSGKPGSRDPRARSRPRTCANAPDALQF